MKKRYNHIFLTALILFIVLYNNSQALELANSKKTTPKYYSFIQNKGQWDDEVLFLAEMRGVNVWVCKESIKFEYYKIKKLEEKNKNNVKMHGMHDLLLLADMKEENAKYKKKSHVIQMDFVGCNDKLQTKGLKKEKAYYNYFIGNDKDKWASNVPLFGEVIIEDLYDGIDLKLYFDNVRVEGIDNNKIRHAKNLRYDFIVKPGADPSQIKLGFKGQNGISLNQKGEVNLSTIFGEVRHGEVYAYQNTGTEAIEGTKHQEQEISCTFKQIENIISFNTAAYDKTKQLVIDPLVYSTFVGECAIMKSIDLYLKEDHGLYFAISTASNLYPRTAGAYDTDFNGFVDMGITVFDDRTFALKFSTYIGSSKLDEPRNILIDSEDNIIIIGDSQDGDFPVTDNCYQSKSSGLTDVAIIKLKNDGTELLYSSYFGGEDLDIPYKSLFVDDNTFIFAGYTLSQDYPATNSKHSEHKGYFDVFLTRMNISTNEILFSGLFGGEDEEHVNSLEFDRKNNIILSGYTNSKDFVVTENAYSKTYFGGYTDIFIIKLDKETDEMITSTYFGGSGFESTYEIAFDKHNNMILSGGCTSTDIPITDNSYQKKIFPTGKYQYQDCYISVFNEDLNTIKASTYIGGRGVEASACIREYDENSIIICGHTNSENFPTTPDALDPIKGGDFELMIFIMDKNLEELHYSTFFGGSFDDYVYEMELNSEKKLYFTGATKSFDYPVTEDAFDPTYNSRGRYFDSFISVMDIPEMYVSVQKEYPEEDDDLIVFPSPADGFITIKSKMNFAGRAIIGIHNIYGETCIEKHVWRIEDNIEIDISELPAGKYYCRITTVNGVSHGGFIKL